MTPLQRAMINKIAFDEFTPANGSPPTQASETETWADGIIESAEDKGVFTSLLNAGAVWHSGVGRDAVVGLTNAGFEYWFEMYSG